MPKINDNGTDRDMTADEVAAYEAWAAQQQADNAANQAADEARAAARASALAKLGLSPAEVAALFG